MIISNTAIQRGFGKDKWKRVINLTTEEKAIIRAGESVYFRSTALSGGNHGTHWRRVEVYRDDFYPRVPGKIELSLLGE